MTLQDVLSRLASPHQNDRGWMARCPAHRDTSPSLSIAPGRRDGYILLHCFRGCDRGAILAALGLADEPGASLTGASPEPDGGSPAWWAQVHRLAIQQGLRAQARRDRWWGEVRNEGADLHRGIMDRVAALQMGAECLGPDDPAAWFMLERADALEHERRRLGDLLDTP